MAGLAAANSLCSAETNFQVTILEASNQVGGRTRSVAMGTQLVDVGATNMYYSPGRDEGDPLVEYAISRGLVEQIVEAGQIQTCVSDKPPLYLLSSGEKLPTKMVTHYKEVFYQAQDLLVEQVKVKDQTDPIRMKRHTSNHSSTSLNASLADNYYSILNSKGKEMKISQERSNVAKWGPGHVLDYMLRIEAISNGVKLNENVDIPSYGDFHDEEQHCILPDGYQSVAIKLAEDLPPQVLMLNKEVKTICWSPSDTQHSTGGPVTITCTDGSHFTADHVITTVSLGVLKEKCGQFHSHIQRHDEKVPLFSPPLPKKKLEAIQKLGFGSLSKVLVEFPEPLSKEHGNLELLWMEKDHSFPESHAWASKQAHMCRLSNSSIYETWFVGTDSHSIDSASDQEVAEGIALVAEKFMGRTLARPTEIIREKWSSLPHFLGAYSFNATGTGKMERETLSKPVDGRTSLQLLFAGEATHSTLYSTVNGAYESGIREAQRLRKHYLKIS